MLSTVLEWLAHLIISVIDTIGYLGVFFLMALDSFNIPIPSEVTMPFSGFLASEGRVSFWLIVLVGTLGSYVGSVCSYYLAEWLVSHRHKAYLHFILNDVFLQKATAWFSKYGSLSVFFGRIIPVVRTFISLPAGLGKVPFGKFSYLTIAGSFVWSLFLTYVGWTLGKNWNQVREYFHQFDVIIVVLILIGIGWWVYRHVARKEAKV